ncbi:MAG: ZIP family metal transporter [Flavobacteriales bacterium]
MNISYGLILLFSTITGGALAYYLQKEQQKGLKLLLSFSGAYLLSACILHFLPIVMKEGKSFFGLMILCGFFLQILLEFISGGVEHGHIHSKYSHISAMPWAVFISLSLHSMLEVMPIVHHEHLRSYSLFIGLTLHKLPVAAALMTLLLESGLNKRIAFTMIFLFGLIPFSGMAVSILIQYMAIDMQFYFNSILSLVIGILLHVSTTILFEHTEGHGFNFMKLAVIIAAVMLSWFFI